MMRLVMMFGLLGTALLVAQPLTPGPKNPANSLNNAVVISAASEPSYKRLAEIERKLLSTKPLEGLDDLLRLLESSADDLVSPPGSTQARPVRLVAQELLTRLPPDSRKSYREKVEGAARRLVDQGIQQHDPRLFQEAVSRYFPAPATEEALFWLGEYAFDRGDYRLAEQHWRRILRDSPSAEAAFPDPQREPATIAARVILAIIFAGEKSRAQAELVKFGKAHGQAAGRLAGQNGPYMKTLEQWLAKPVLFPPVEDGEGEWLTFGGAANRSGLVQARMPYYWPSQPAWRATLPAQVGPTPTMPKATSARRVGLHPIILNNMAYVADSTRLFGYDLQTGTLRLSYDLRQVVELKSDPPDWPAITPIDADFSLSAGGGFLFARLGDPALLDGSGGAAPVQDVLSPCSYLVGFSASVAETPLQWKWKLPPPVPAGTLASWEGAPVWHEHRIYATFVRNSANRAVTAVACFEDIPGEPIWVTDLVEANPSSVEKRNRHELLSIDGDRLVYCSHTGAVVAVHRGTGKLLWSFRYPKMTPKTPGFGPESNRDICPPIISGGRVFVAPNDADQLFVLDLYTGQQLWKVEGVQIDHLLGVTQQKLIAAINAPVRGIRAWDVVSGSDQEPLGWRVHDDPQLRSFGRGLVSSQMILWPTNTGLFFLSPTDGSPLRASLRGPHGNLAFAKGVLLVGRASELWGYVSERLDLPARLQAVAQAPDQPGAQLDLAKSLADSGRWDEAADALKRAEPLVDAARVQAEWQADRLEAAVRYGDTAQLARLSRERPTSPEWAARLDQRLGRTPSVSHLSLNLANTLPQRRGDEQAALSRSDRIENASPQEMPIQPLLPGARVQSMTRFPSFRTVPLQPFSGDGLPGLSSRMAADRCLLVSDGPTISAYAPQSNKPKWTLKLPEGIRVFQAGDVGESVVAAGPDAVIRFRLRDGHLEWANWLADVDRIAQTGQTVQLRSLSPSQGLKLSRFALTDSRLVAWVETDGLLAFDLADGHVAWAVNSLGQPRLRRSSFGIAPHFSPEILVDEDFIIAQSNAAERWIIRTFDGKILERATGPLVPWSGPPVRNSRGVYLVPSGPESVQALTLNFANSRRAVVNWEVNLKRPSSASGKPPELAIVADSLMLLVERNHGWEVERHDALTGRRAWTGPPPLFPARPVRISEASSGNSLLALATETNVTAIRLADGRRTWQYRLPEAGATAWRPRFGRDTVLVYPQQPISPDRQGESWMNWADHWPQRFWRLPSFPAIVYDAWRDHQLPLHWIDAKTGQLVHRLELAVGPVVAVHLAATACVVATAGRAYWLTN